MAYTPVLNPQPIKIPDLATTGTLAALSAVVVTASSSQGIVAIQLTGTWVGTITFQGTEDPLGVTAPSTSWFNVNGVASVSGLQLTNVTANGQFRVNAGGYTAVRAIMTVFTSGSATVWINASSASSMATLAEPLPVGANTIGNVGSSSATGVAKPANAFLIGGSDGTNLQPILTGTDGKVAIRLSDSFGNGIGQATPGDTLGGTSTTALAVTNFATLFDGTNYFRARGNESVALLTSAARTATATSADLINYNGRSIIDIILDMTVVGTGSVTVTINGKDPASGKYYLLLSGAAVITNVTNVYTLNPQLATAVANVSAQKAIPRIFQIVVTANNANTATYSVGYNIMRG